MTIKQELEAIIPNIYESEDGDFYKVDPLAGMTDDEIDSFKRQLPNSYLPVEIEELLRFCKGFEFDTLDEVCFDAIGYFGFEEVFPNSIQLAGDGLGNFWILDIDSKGNWNSVYYVCHDPAVIVKQSENLGDFIKHIDEFGKLRNESLLDLIHEQSVMKVWNDKFGIMSENKKDYDFENEPIAFPESYLIADLSDKPVDTGFIWALSGPNTKIIRPTDAPIWIVEKKVKQGFLARLFGGKR